MSDEAIPITCVSCGASGTIVTAEDILAWQDTHPCTARKRRKRRGGAS